ncbi:hypothetical protein EV659_1102 [Rhodothalassium salexigens DSM 2132]|uniref:Uncharacterized protein n=1 Tax=Rhodothalassium salexigens DSM 2132 TaxID=1188247 RepID=A0A4V2SNP4_RHOSA|nr:hypothetical protein [Rhodothalassium salexigens]MBB4212443.1 hypothetical protein [Rhodothalassium salexigens DSM 2132]TCP31926.1 hypothetical protein EV659_1102 [Rhodothalassium salexigens DSM 2132]
MSGPSRREEQDRRSGQPVNPGPSQARFSLKRLFNKLTGLLGIRALFNWFARPRGPRPEPIKIDPAWFPVPQPTPAPEADEWLPPGLVPPKPHLPSWEPPWVQTFEPPWVPPWEQACASPPEVAPETMQDDDYVDEYAFAEDNPGWDDEPTEPAEDAITVRPGERVPLEAGELLRTYYAPGIGDVRVFAQLDPNEMDIDPEQVLGPDNLEMDGPQPEKKPKVPK